MTSGNQHKSGEWFLSRRTAVLSGGALAAAWLAGGCQSTGNTRAQAEPLPTPIGQEPLKPMPELRPTPGGVSPSPVPTAIAVVPRSAWTREGARTQYTNPLGTVTRITIHHEGSTVFTATAQEDVARRLASIRASHLQRKAKRTGQPWADIGYHYAIDPGGRVWEGRSLQYQGAHVDQQNEQNLGIVMLGNYDRQSPNRAQIAALDAFVADQMRRYHVRLNRVYTHQELDSTACPGSALQRYMLATRRGGGGLVTASA